jgi:indolepyruvate ferredoxin oxidoreductase beta subunit
MGRLARQLDIPYEKWEEALKTVVKPKFIDINLKAFALGYNYSE